MTAHLPARIVSLLSKRVHSPGAARKRAILFKRLKAALLAIAVVAASLLFGIMLAKVGHSLFNEPRAPLSRGNG